MRAIVCAIISFIFCYISFNANKREIEGRAYIFISCFIFMAISIALMICGK